MISAVACAAIQVGDLATAADYAAASSPAAAAVAEPESAKRRTHIRQPRRRDIETVVIAHTWHGKTRPHTAGAE